MKSTFRALVQRARRLPNGLRCSEQANRPYGAYIGLSSAGFGSARSATGMGRQHAISDKFAASCQLHDSVRHTIRRRPSRVPCAAIPVGPCNSLLTDLAAIYAMNPFHDFRLYADSVVSWARIGGSSVECVRPYNKLFEQRGTRTLRQSYICWEGLVKFV